MVHSVSLTLYFGVETSFSSSSRNLVIGIIGLETEVRLSVLFESKFTEKKPQTRKIFQLHLKYIVFVTYKSKVKFSHRKSCKFYNTLVVVMDQSLKKVVGFSLRHGYSSVRRDT